MLSDTNTEIFGIMQPNSALNISVYILIASSFAPVYCKYDLVLHFLKLAICTHKQMENCLRVQFNG